MSANSPFTPHMISQHHQSHSQQSSTTSANNQSIHAADQSKHLIELNKQLSRQIENNMVLMDNLSCQDIQIGLPGPQTTLPTEYSATNNRQEVVGVQ